MSEMFISFNCEGVMAVVCSYVYEFFDEFLYYAMSMCCRERDVVDDVRVDIRVRARVMWRCGMVVCS